MREIEIKDQLSPTEVEIRTEFGKNKLGLSWAKLSHSWPKLIISFHLISQLSGLD